MRKINWVIALLSVFSLTFAACGGDDVEGKRPVQKLPTASTASFNAAISEITYDSVIFNVTPNDLEQEYFCVIETAAVVDDFSRDMYLVGELNQNLESAAASLGYTKDEYVAECLDKGVVEREFKGLVSETKYYLLVVSVEDVINEVPRPEILKLAFTTDKAPVLDVQFKVDTEVNGTNATVNVTPYKGRPENADKEAIWFYAVLPSAQYAEYMNPETYNLTPEQIVKTLYQDNLNQLTNNGLDIKQAINKTFYVGPHELKISNLYYNTEYTNIVAGFHIDREDVTITLATPITTTTFKTGDIGPVDMTFTITVENIRAMQAAVKVVPSTNKHTFYWQVGAYDGKSTAEEVMANMSVYTVYSTTQNYPNFTLESPDTDYYVIAFGYAPGAGITTAPVMTTFRSAKAPAAEDTTFTVKASSVTPYGFTFKVTSSEYTTYYLAGVVKQDAYNEEQVVKDLNKVLADDYAVWKKDYPDLTIPQFLYSYNMYGYAHRGNVSLDATVEPGTTYLGYVCAIDPNTNTVAKTHVFENLVTTNALSNVKPEINIYGIYSGREENGRVFDDAEYTKDKAILVVEYGNLDDARSLFTYMTEEELSNAMTYPDVDIWNFIRASGGEWYPMKDLKKPYDFFLVSWKTDFTVFAYTIGNDGVQGSMARKSGMAIADEKGDIDDLLELVDKLNPKKETTSLRLPSSLVVEE